MLDGGEVINMVEKAHTNNEINVSDKNIVPSTTVEKFKYAFDPKDKLVRTPPNNTFV